eukprot:447050_1
MGSDISSPCSCNEFGNDHLNAKRKRNTVRNIDIFDKLERIKSSQLYHILSNERILYDSLFKIYSFKSYIDIAGILTKNKLYFTSATNYQLWQQFTNRCQFDYLLNKQHMTQKDEIDHKLAEQLANNLNLCDEKTNDAVVLPYFMGKTHNQIKLSIITKDTKYRSIAEFFQRTNDNTDVLLNCKDKRYIEITNFYNDDVIKETDRHHLLQYIFTDKNNDQIPWIEENKMNDSLIITLHMYHSTSIITIFDDRKTQFFSNRSLAHEQSLNIRWYEGYNIKTSILDIYMVNLKKCQLLHEFITKTVEDYENEYIFALKSGKNIIKLKCSSQNIGYEWVTHLDYVINYTDNQVVKSITNDEKKNDSISNDKLMNDFSNSSADEKQHDIFETKFSFGEYLNYWEKQFENSVVPKYPTLKHELLQNRIATINSQQYYQLYKECLELMSIRGYAIKAQNIGVNNVKFNIPKGMTISINHLISLKIYTDFTNVQRKLKKHCRKHSSQETLEQFIRRHCQIAHWSRYLKESCTFYGTLMPKKMTFYCGLNAKLMFDSLQQHFECPISTTSDKNIANNFSENSGIILTIKRANSKTRYFNVSWLSEHGHEMERLFMGSSLKISNIWFYFNHKWNSSKLYIASIQMFEDIINGKFMDKNEETQNQLYIMIISLLKMKCDKSNVLKTIESPYMKRLFQNMIKRMQQKAQLNDLWMNKKELEGINHTKLRQLLCINNDFFEKIGVNKSCIKWVQEYSWKITDNQYIEFKNMRPGQYIKSQEYEFIIMNDKKHQQKAIKFYLQTCAKHSYESNKCALFLHLEPLPVDIIGIKIEYDVLCIKSPIYKNYMEPQWLSNEKPYCGFQVFGTKNLQKNNSVEWKIGLKITDMKVNTERKNTLYLFWDMSKMLC